MRANMGKMGCVYMILCLPITKGFKLRVQNCIRLSFVPFGLLGSEDPSPNWLDDWTVLGSESVGKTKENLLDGWIESPCSVKPTSPVVQHGDVAFQKPLKQEAPVTKHQDDLAEVFASAFPMPKPVAVENPFRCGCAQKSSDREKDFWDSVNWDELLS